MLDHISWKSLAQIDVQHLANVFGYNAIVNNGIKVSSAGYVGHTGKSILQLTLEIKSDDRHIGL